MKGTIVYPYRTRCTRIGPTIGELVKMLSKYDPDAEVVVDIGGVSKREGAFHIEPPPAKHYAPVWAHVYGVEHPDSEDDHHCVIFLDKVSMQ